MSTWTDTLDRLPVDHLYRFRSFDDQHKAAEPEEIVRDSLLHFAGVDQLNDPFECKPIFNWSQGGASAHGDIKGMVNRQMPGASYGDKLAMRERVSRQSRRPELIAAFREKCEATFADYYRTSSICTFTTHPDSLPMWAYYGDSHRGYVVAFSTPLHVDFSLRGERCRIDATPVIYDKAYPAQDLDAVGDPKALGEAAFRSLIAKSDQWQHEKEWRLVRAWTREPRLQTFEPSRLAAVVAGARISSERANRLEQLCRTRSIPYYLASIAEGTFGLTYARVA